VFFHSASRSMDRLLEQRLRRAFDSERVDFDARVCIIPNLPRALERCLTEVIAQSRADRLKEGL
jgi:hypothetical protein